MRKIFTIKFNCLYDIIILKLINHSNNNFLASYFSFQKNLKIMTLNYHRLKLYKNRQNYKKDFDICLILKIKCHKSHNNLYLLLVSLY